MVVILQRNESSLLCFVGIYAFVLRLARLFRQVQSEVRRVLLPRNLANSIFTVPRGLCHHRHREEVRSREE